MICGTTTRLAIKMYPGKISFFADFSISNLELFQLAQISDLNQLWSGNLVFDVSATFLTVLNCSSTNFIC